MCGELPGENRAEIDLALLRAQDQTGLLADIDRALVWQIPMRVKFRGITSRDGIVLHGPAGWAEVAPFWGYDAATSAPWLASGLEQAVQGLATLPRRRTKVPVNVTVAELDPQAAYAWVCASAAETAKVKVAGTASALPADLARLEAVRAALGAQGKIRIDVNGAWDVQTALQYLPQMEVAAAGLEYVEQPCAQVEELAYLRQKLDIPVAADESVRLAADPFAVTRLHAADLVVLKVAPLGGVRRALALAQRLDLPAVVSSALDTSLGIGAGTVLGGALPELNYACGLGTLNLFTADLAAPSLLPSAGAMPVGQAEVVPSVLTQVLTKDATLRARWTQRLGQMVVALAARREREARGCELEGGVAL